LLLIKSLIKLWAEATKSEMSLVVLELKEWKNESIDYTISFSLFSICIFNQIAILKLLPSTLPSPHTTKYINWNSSHLRKKFKANEGLDAGEHNIECYCPLNKSYQSCCNIISLMSRLYSKVWGIIKKRDRSKKTDFLR